MGLSNAELTKILEKAGWPKKDLPYALGIIGAESGGNPTVVGWDYAGATVQDTSGPQPNSQWSSYDTGLFQINSVHDQNAPGNTYDPTWISSMQDPVQNAKEAYSLFAGQGLAPWASDAYVQSIGGPSALSAPGSGASPVSVPTGSTATLDSSGGSGGGLWGAVSEALLGPILGNPAATGAASKAASSVFGATANDVAKGIVGGVIGITNMSTAQEFGLRMAEVISGALLFAIGLFLMFEALAGRSAGGDVGTALKTGAAGAAVF